MDSELEDRLWYSNTYVAALLFALFLPVIVWFYGSSLRQWLASFVSMLWRIYSGEHDKPRIRHKKGSLFCERVVKKCGTLQEPYTPPLLWGRSGHIQSILFGFVGRFNIPPISGQRHSIIVRDGSTLYYDVYEPKDMGACPITVLVCPGIGSTSESDYIKSFSSHAVEHGLRVVVFNHLGALPGEKLTGRRIFSYGGTGDLSAVFDHASALYPHTKFVGVGFSMGACVLMRFLGEDEKRRRRFVCAASVCQGYDPSIAMKYMHDWTNFRRLYNYGIAQRQLSLLRRHSDALLTSIDLITTPPTRTTSTSAHSSDSPSEHRTDKENLTDSPIYPHVHRCHGDYDHNGIALDREQIQPPHTEGLKRVSSVLELDEYFTRRVSGFSSPQELYRWTSCVELMNEIRDLPVLIVNSRDDPLVDTVHSDVLEIPKKYTELNPRALLVIPRHGGHLGFFEGGVFLPNSTAWVDRLLVQYTQACVTTDSELSN